MLRPPLTAIATYPAFLGSLGCAQLVLTGAASRPCCFGRHETAGRDLFSALQLAGRGGTKSCARLFGWWRRGARVSIEIARAINYCHHKVSGWQRPGGRDVSWCAANRQLQPPG